jgi:hypothetical protein
VITRRGPLALVVALVSVGLAGCGGNTSGTGTASSPSASAAPPPSAAAPSPLPPRPAALRLDGVDPCSLLTPAQVSQLKLSQGSPGANSDGLGSPDCGWHALAATPRDVWIARTVLKQGAEFYLGSVTGARVIQVAGFPAVQTSSDLAKPDLNCIMFIDVAPGQCLGIFYSNSFGDRHGINHEVACQQADRVAELLVANLRALRS